MWSPCFAKYPDDARPVGVARHRLADAHHAHLLADPRRAAGNHETGRELGGIHRVRPHEHGRADVESEAVPHHLVHDGFVGAPWVGHAPGDQRAGVQPHRRGVERIQRRQIAGGARTDDPARERDHEGIRPRHARELRHLGPLLGAEGGVVGEQGRRRQLDHAGGVGDRPVGPAGARPSRPRPRRRPTRRARRAAATPSSAPAARPGPTSTPRSRCGHRLRCSCTLRANHRSGGAERGKAPPGGGVADLPSLG